LKKVVITDLAAGVDSNASSIAVFGGDVYVAGDYNDTSTQTACYWKNGVRTDLSTTGNSAARAIVVVE
jgi:hypothetical protein